LTHPDTYYVDQSHPRANDKNPGTDDAPFKTIRAAAKAIQGGDTVIVMPGVYRETVGFSASGTPEKPTVIRASENYKVIVTGADLVTGWERNAPLVTRQTEVFEEPDEQEKKEGDDVEDLLGGDGAGLAEVSEEHAATAKKQEAYDKGITSIWVKKGYRYRIMSYYPPHHFEQVVLDGRPLRQVFRKEDMSAGTFYCGDKDLSIWPHQVPEVRHGFTPENWWEDINQGHTVEVSRRAGTLHARGNYIHVKGFIFRYGCNQAQASLAGGGGRGVVFEDCIAEYSGGGGIGLSGEGVVLRRVIARFNGNKGATTGFCWNGLWEDVELCYNNTKGFSAMFECGGSKCCGQRDCVFRRVHAHHNWAPGIWLDIDNRDCIFEDCWANDNSGPGFVTEISQGITWRNCVSIRNGSGIGIWESFNCVVEHCTLVDNHTGIRVRGGSLGHARALTGWPRRDKGIYVPYRVGDLVIRNNILAYNGSQISAVNHPDDFKTLDYNLYWPRWGQSTVCRVGGMSTLEQLRSAGFELHGRVGPPLFVDRGKEDFRLRADSPAAGMCRRLPNVPKDKDGKPRDPEATSAGAYELPRQQRSGEAISEAQALKMLEVCKTEPVRTDAGLELRSGQSLRLLWSNAALVSSDSLGVNAVVSRPGWGRRIWHSGARRRGDGQSFTAQITANGRPTGTVSTWNEPGITMSRRQAALDGATAEVWYRVSVLPGCVYRPNLVQFSMALPGRLYAGVPYRFRDKEGEVTEGKELAEQPIRRQVFTDLQFSLPAGTVRFVSGQTFMLGWNNRQRQYYLAFTTPIDATRGLDLSWTVKVSVEAAK